jgi:hypothetical protein
MITDARLSHLSTGLGAAEARSEPYIRYGERALEAATTARAKSDGGVGGTADEQAITVRKS